MKISSFFSSRLAAALVATVASAIAAAFLWDYYVNEPWTRDGRVCADIVRLATDVSGPVSEVLARDNQTVKKGDVLFRVDRARFLLALRQSEANLADATSALELAKRELARNRPMEGRWVSHQELDELNTAVSRGEAAYRRAEADRDIARLDLERSDVRSPVNGFVTNFSLREGNHVTAGQPVMAIVDADSYYVAGYFEETKLPRIHIGAPAEARLMGGGGELRGHVCGIAAGIEDRERGESSRLLANVNPTFSWVRLPQRVPVRISLDPLPGGSAQLVAGQTVTVVIGTRNRPANQANKRE